MSNTPRLAFPEISESQSSKYVTHNEALRQIDCLVQLAVIDKDLATPPGTPADGDSYIVASTPTGAWVGHATHIAYYKSSGWLFVTPLEGFVAYVADENSLYIFNGSAWALFTAATGVGDVLGPGTHAADYVPQWSGTPNSKTLVEGFPITAAGKAIVDDATAGDQRSTLGLGNSATKDVGAITGTVCAGDDARLSDSRTPAAHVLDGALHTVAGLTTGHFLKATGATTFGFAAHGLTLDGGVGIGFEAAAKPTATGSYSCLVPYAMTLPASLTGSAYYGAVNPSAEVVVSLKKNGTEFGTLTVTAGGSPTFASGAGATLAAGDRVTFTFPAQDSTWAGVAITLKGSRSL